MNKQKSAGDDEAVVNEFGGETLNFDENHHSFSKTQWIVIGFLFALIFLFIWIEVVHPASIDEIAIDTEERLFAYYRNHRILGLLLLHFLMAATVVLCTGMSVIVTMITAFIIKDFWLSFWFIYGSFVLADIYAFLIASKLLQDAWRRSMHNNEYVCIMKKEVRKHPWRTAFTVRFLMMPGGVKDYVLTFLKVPFWLFLFSSVVEQSIFAFLTVLMAHEFSQIAAYLSHKNDWESASTGERTMIVLTAFFLLFTIGFFVFVGWRLKRRVDSLRERRKRRAAKRRANKEQ